MTATCRSCGRSIDWGLDAATGRWVPLEPRATHDDLDRTFVDEDGALRADHRARHGARTVSVTRLDRRVPAATATAHEAEIVRAERNRRRRERGKTGT